MKNATSDDFYDDLVVLCFHVLPSMDSAELAAFINTIVRLADQEVLRATSEARGRIINEKRELSMKFTQEMLAHPRISRSLICQW